MNLLLLAALGLTAPQHDCITAAYRAGQPYGLAETTAAIVLVESSACTDLVGDDGTSFGAGQLQLTTARELRPGITARQLVRNRDLNLQLTAANLNRCRLRHGSWRLTVMCHNSPRRAASLTEEQAGEDAYVLRVRKALAFLRRRYGAE